MYNLKNALIVASVASMIDQFTMNNIFALQELGYNVEVAANFQEGNTSNSVRIERFKCYLNEINIKYYQVSFSRNILDFSSNKRAYNELKKIADKGDYDLIHSHSPIGGVIGRLVAKNVGSISIYTAHGFHFYKGGSIKNWLLFYPIEKFLSRFTDTLITINNEDYSIASSKFHAKKIKKINGIGVDFKKIVEIEIDKPKKIRELGIKEDSFLLLSVGELNENKNHKVILNALAKMENKNIDYVICGKGPLEKKLKKMCIDLNIQNRVHFLGFREDIYELYKICDLFVFPSLREGLSVALIEAMACGLPVVCSNIRGNRDLIKYNHGGILVNPKNTEEFEQAINRIYLENHLAKKFSRYNKISVEQYSSEVIKDHYKLVYQTYTN